jgi:hypothetical protein
VAVSETMSGGAVGSRLTNSRRASRAGSTMSRKTARRDECVGGVNMRRAAAPERKFTRSSLTSKLNTKNGKNRKNGKRNETENTPKPLNLGHGERRGKRGVCTKRRGLGRPRAPPIARAKEERAGCGGEQRRKRHGRRRGDGSGAQGAGVTQAQGAAKGERR